MVKDIDRSIDHRHNNEQIYGSYEHNGFFSSYFTHFNPYILLESIINTMICNKW